MSLLRHLPVFLLTLPLLGWSQTSYDDVQYDEIPFKKIRTYLGHQQELAQVERFADLGTSVDDVEDFSDFYRYERRYKVKLPLQHVWDTYKTASPTQAWTTRKSSCGLMYERQSDRIFYPSDSSGGIDHGQILYMEMKLIKGLYRLATAFEITKVEDELGVIEVSYSQSGVNEGKQVIQMVEDQRGNTIIHHTSMIRSGHYLRDRILYPYFHNRLINAFHRKMKRLAKTHDAALAGL